VEEEVTPRKRADPHLPPGAARDLVDLFKRLRDSSQLRVGQIANRTGYAPGHISEVLRGWKAPSPEAAARIAQALGGNEVAIRRARRYAEDLREWKQTTRKKRSSPLDCYDVPNLKEQLFTLELSNPDIMINIIGGNLFDQDTHLAVGFSDTFDTSIEDDRIIHSSSVQGQMLQRCFGSDQRQLDEALSVALATVTPVTTESRQDKPYGKLTRYPLGTTVVLGEPRRLIFGLAYGRMGNDLVVRAPLEGLWYCYSQLWEAVYRYGQRMTLSIPLMGAGLARIDALDRRNLLRLMLLSFVAYSRLQLVCSELRIVIHPNEVRRIDLASLRPFLRDI
jgi:transcriptional regulator with XRE-family HTH domain